MTSRAARLIWAGVAVASLAFTLGIAAPAAATPDGTPPKYPSWSDVEKAKRNEASKKAEITRITGLVDDLETASAAAGKIALQRNEEYNQARDALAAAEQRSDELAAQVTAAQERADVSARRAGQLVAQLARTGSGDVTLGLLLGANGDSSPDDLLARLGAVSKLSEHSSELYSQAVQQRNSASALAEQSRAAESERDRLAARAKTVLANAKRAAAEAAARVEEQRATSARLTAQLASLKGTTARTQREYLAGVAWEKAQEAIKNPPPPAPPVNPPPPAPSGSAVAGAIAFAKAQLGERYVLGGAGPSVWDCSGLTRQSYAAVGVYIGTHSATNQYDTMRAAGRLVPLNEMVAGDLLWYSSGGSTSGSKYHVTLYIGGGQMIEAPYPGEVVRIRPVRYGDLVPYAGRPTP